MNAPIAPMSVTPPVGGRTRPAGTPVTHYVTTCHREAPEGLGEPWPTLAQATAWAISHVGTRLHTVVVSAHDETLAPDGEAVIGFVLQVHLDPTTDDAVDVWLATCTACKKTFQARAGIAAVDAWSMHPCRGVR